jgi:hypothetical protein
MTQACSYDGGDCGGRSEASKCERCGKTKCRECFAYGSAKCVGCATSPPGCVEECSFCSLCQACAPCYDGGEAGSVCEKDAEEVVAMAEAVKDACAASAMADPPSCSVSCRVALQPASSGDCWSQVHAAAPPGLVAVVLQVRGGLSEGALSFLFVPL